LALFAGARPSRAADHAVQVGPSLTFTPAELTIDAGDTVTWTWDGANHSVTFDDGSFDSDVHSSPYSTRRGFSRAGRFPYYCKIHGGRGGSGMHGVITVRGAASASPAATPTRRATPQASATPRSSRSATTGPRPTPPAATPRATPRASRTSARPAPSASASARRASPAAGTSSAAAAPTVLPPPAATEPVIPEASRLRGSVLVVSALVGLVAVGLVAMVLRRRRILR
ncbi:MAG: hypothetical protein LC640_12140, partial [Frankia sp.]|nr:hypothetical protein [Frankia sp.]